MTTPEGRVRDPAVRWARNHGIMHIRMSFRPGVTAGIPDDVFLYRGRLVAIEFKREGKEPTPLQAKRINDLRNQGFTADWFDNTADAVAFLKQHLIEG